MLALNAIWISERSKVHSRPHATWNRTNGRANQANSVHEPVLVFVTKGGILEKCANEAQWEVAQLGLRWNLQPDQ